MQKTLIILRGLPGSGKTTLTSQLKQQYGRAVVCSADHFFYFGKDFIPENYKFDCTLLGQAHGQCKYRAEQAMIQNCEVVIIDNTNIKLVDFKFYILAGAQNGYVILSHAIAGMSAEESARLNTHNVPLKSCVRMYQSYDPAPAQIIEKNIMVEITEIVHDYVEIRKGVFGNGNFDKTHTKKG